MHHPLPRKFLIFAFCLVLAACRPKPVQPTSISFDPPKAKLGGAVTLHVDQAPPSWSGQIAVRKAIFRVDSKNPGFQISAANGFTESGNTDMFITLIDGRGYEIPLANRGRLILEVLPSNVTIAPSSDEVSAAGGPGRFRISAPDDFRWSATAVPDWVQLTSAAEGSGGAVLEYKTTANTTGRDRTAKIIIGDAVFELRQPAPRSSGFSPFRTADDTTRRTRETKDQAAHSDSSATSK